MHHAHELGLQPDLGTTQPADRVMQFVTGQVLDINGAEQLDRFFEQSESCRHNPIIYEHMLSYKLMFR